MVLPICIYFDVFCVLPIPGLPDTMECNIAIVLFKVRQITAMIY